MPALTESEKLDGPEFKWGKIRDHEEKNNDVQFYESFTYDGVDYSLYDCVYMYKHGEPAPYIGKLIEMWESSEKINMIKVQWFFRPSEISYYLKDVKVLENELFFASGDGKGLANSNPPEAVAGKCNVVCISTDRRNPQPSAEELQMADYVFYQIFDVSGCTISDQMDDKVGELEVNFVFNRRNGVRTLDSPKLDSGENHDARNVIACEATQIIAGNSSLQQFNKLKLDKNGNQAPKEDTNVRQVPINQGSVVGKHSSTIDVVSNRSREITGTIIEERNTMGAKNIENNTCDRNAKLKDIESPVSLVQSEKGTAKYAGRSCDVGDVPSKRTKIDGSVSSDSNCVEVPSIPRNDAALLLSGATTSKGKLRSGLVRDSVGFRHYVKLAENSGPLDEKLSKTDFSLPREASRSGHAEDAVGLQKNSKPNENLNALSKTKVLPPAEKKNLGSALQEDSFVSEKNEKLGEMSSETNVVSHAETQRPSTANFLPNQTQKSVPNDEFKGSGQSEKPIQSLSTAMRRSANISAQGSKVKSTLGHDKSRANNEGPGQAAKPLPILSTSMKRTLEISAGESKQKSNLGHGKSCENKEGSGQGAKPLQSFPTSARRTLENSNPGCDKFLEKGQVSSSSSRPYDERYRKKAKLDDSIKRLKVNKNNKIKNLKDNNTSGETKNSSKCATSSDNSVTSRSNMGRSDEYNNAKVKANVGETKGLPKFTTCDDKEELRIGECHSKLHHKEKDDKPLKDNLPSTFASKSKDDGEKVGGKIIEVTPRPPDKPTWMKFSWDELMKTAHDQGRLVLLQNLDPEYSSGEVEDILWHAFQENCNARIVPHTAISNPYSGQAFVVFKSRGVANKVVQKLGDECLMLPNQRPLIACHGVLPKSEKHIFVGHLIVDKGRRQIQRDMKEALSTSHYSQPNTIEFAMAVEWCMLQIRSDKWWETLHETQQKELKNLREDLKSK